MSFRPWEQMSVVIDVGLRQGREPVSLPKTDGDRGDGGHSRDRRVDQEQKIAKILQPVLQTAGKF